MFETANYMEAALWGLLAVAMCVVTARSQVHRRRAVAAALVLFAFGASDLVEVHTGAWWRPPWLLVWKGVCVILLFALCVSHFRAMRRRDEK